MPSSIDLAHLDLAIGQQKYISVDPPQLIELARNSSIHIFSGFRSLYAANFCWLDLDCGRRREIIDIPGVLIPALIHAHRYFGDQLPADLIQKLRNAPQTNDTLFELRCVGNLSLHHRVHYEPKLKSGKVPDLLIELPPNTRVYVECKVQHDFDADHSEKMKKVAIELSEILTGKTLRWIQKAFSNGLRLEVRLSRMPNSSEIAQLALASSKARTFEALLQDLEESVFLLSLTSRQKPFDETIGEPRRFQEIGTDETDITSENTYLAIYPWEGLNRDRIRSQRRLLALARKKLKEMPSDAFGMICIQIAARKKFDEDVHKLLLQDEFAKVPIVWLNPASSNGKLICRNDSIWLKDQIITPFKLARKLIEAPPQPSNNQPRN